MKCGKSSGFHNIDKQIHNLIVPIVERKRQILNRGNLSEFELFSDILDARLIREILLSEIRQNYEELQVLIYIYIFIY